MRNMSFSLTTDAVRTRLKKVTRRRGWAFLRPGDLVQACDKCMGLKPGQHPQKLAVIRIVSNRPESILCVLESYKYGNQEAEKEGFPHFNGFEFHAFLMREIGAKPDEILNRIEFEYVD